MRIFDLAIILIIVGMVSVGTSTFLIDADDTYNLNLSKTDFQSLNKINQTNILTTDISNRIETEGIQTDAESEVNVFKVGFSAIKLTFRLPGFFTSLITDAFNTISTQLGIPVVFQSALLAMVGIIIVFGLIYAVVKIRV